MTTLLVLDLYGSLHAVRALGQTGQYRIHALGWGDRNLNRYSRYVRSYYQYADGLTDEQCASYVAEVTRCVKADLILPVDHFSSRLSITYRELLEESAQLVPIPSRETFETVVDKSRFASFLKQNDLPGPDTQIIGDHWDPEGVRLPVIVKPRQGRDGTGVMLFRDPGSVYRWLEQCGRRNEYIAQDYVEGIDLQYSLFCKNGEVIAGTLHRGVTMDQFEGSRIIEFIEDDRVSTLVAELMCRLNWSGIAHVDLRCDVRTSHLSLIEVNPHYWGPMPAAIQAGVNFPDIACQVALGLRVSDPGYELGLYAPFHNRPVRVEPGIMVPWSHTLFPMQVNDPLPYLVSRSRGVLTRLRGHFRNAA